MHIYASLNNANMLLYLIYELETKMHIENNTLKSMYSSMHSSLLIALESVSMLETKFRRCNMHLLTMQIYFYD